MSPDESFWVTIKPHFPAGNCSLCGRVSRKSQIGTPSLSVCACGDLCLSTILCQTPDPKPPGASGVAGMGMLIQIP